MLCCVVFVVLCCAVSCCCWYCYCCCCCCYCCCCCKYSPTAFTTPPIHLPALSRKPLQLRSACAHFSFLQLSHLSCIFLLHSSLFSITARRASPSFFLAASNTPRIAATTSSINCNKTWDNCCYSELLLYGKVTSRRLVLEQSCAQTLLTWFKRNQLILSSALTCFNHFAYRVRLVKT